MCILGGSPLVSNLTAASKEQTHRMCDSQTPCVPMRRHNVLLPARHAALQETVTAHHNTQFKREGGHVCV